MSDHHQLHHYVIWHGNILITAMTSRLLCCLSAHDDEVLDVTFDYTGQLLATASTDGMLFTHCSSCCVCLFNIVYDS